MLGLAVLVIIALVVMRHLRIKPSNERDWVVENKKMAYAEFDGDEVELSNVRDFSWRTTRDYDERWTEMSFRLSEVCKIWLVLEYLGPKRQPVAST